MVALNRLGAVFVKSAPVGEHCDGGGLWLIKREDGGGQWVLRVTVHRRRREMGLGSLSEVSLKDARAAADICSIADLAGGKWPQLVRASLVGIADRPDDEPQSAGVLLLRDASDIFQSRRVERFGSTEVVDALCAIEESPWAEWRGGRPITTRGIAKLLKPFGVASMQDRFGSFYRPADFADAFGRYLSDTPQITATSATDKTSATEKYNEINNYGTCGTSGTYSDGSGENCHKLTSATSYEEEI